MNRPKVVIVVMNYHQEKETAACLARLKEVTYPSYEVVLVDNGSRQDPASLRERFPEVFWIRLQENMGFSAGCNRGIQWGLSQGAGAVLLLNNDAVVASDFLGKMVDTAYSDPKIGITGAVVRRGGGESSPYLAGMRFDFFRAKVRRILPKGRKENPPPEGMRVPAVSGSCFLVKKEVFEKVGLLDERFFIYFEETDFCYRSRRIGIAVAYAPGVWVTHEEGTALGRGGPAIRYLYTRNRFLFLSKHCPLWLLPWSLSVRLFQDVLLLFGFLLRGKPGMSRAVLLGLGDVVRGRFGKGSLGNFLHDAATS